MNTFRNILICLIVFFTVSCREEGLEPSEAIGINKGEELSGQSSLSLTQIQDYYDIPGTCSDYYSKEYACDGYTQLNLPIGAGSPNITPEIASTTAPSPYFTGLQQLTPFDNSKPSIIYIHGWNVEAPHHVFGLPDQWTEQWQLAGYNVLQFHWTQFSYDDGQGCPGMGWFGGGNAPCNHTFEFLKKGGTSDRFLAAYEQVFSNTTAPVRLVAQSSGTNLAIYSLFRMYVSQSYNHVSIPNRLDLKYS